MYLSDAWLPDVWGVEWKTPVPINLLCRGMKKQITLLWSPCCCCLVTELKSSGKQTDRQTDRQSHPHWDTSSGPDWGWLVQELGKQMHWPETEEVYTQTERHTHTSVSPDSRSHTWIPQSHLTSSVSPDSHGGLDQSCESNGGENGSDQLTDGVLVLTNTHGLG